jgi:DNA-binding winged helix-turn-helix (wHTH) protein
MSTQATALTQQEDHKTSESPRSWPTRYARFGQFHVDLQKEELYRDGRRAKMQAKIYQALLVLLGRPGEIIARDEVCKRLWPEALHGNLDANVNTTINKLRLVLGDSPEIPVYIETIPRRGYSFMAEVQFTDELPSPKRVTGANGVLKDPKLKLAEHDPQKNRWFSLLRSDPTPLLLASFVLVGILIGALLVLAWNSASNGGRATQNLSQHSVARPAAADREL